MARASSNSGKPGGGEGKGGYTIRVTFSSLISAGIVTLIGLGWVFMLGVIVGRGYHPEQKVPELARILPAQPHTAPPAPAQAQRNDVIKAEELKFMNSLKGRPTGNNTTPTTTATAPAAPAKAQQKSAEKTEQAKPSAKELAEAKARENSRKAQEQKAEAARKAQAEKKAKAEAAKAEAAKAEAAKNDTFDYVYQVAAFKDEGPAKTMRGKLETAGLRARVETQKDKTVTWYRILVSFRGTPEDTRALRATLLKQGIDKIIMRSKVPATGKAKS